MTDQQGALSEQEQRQLAAKLLSTAWKTAVEQGVEEEVISAIAVAITFTEMVSRYGEEAVAGMASRLPEQIRSGAFTPRGVGHG